MALSIVEDNHYLKPDLDLDIGEHLTIAMEFLQDQIASFGRIRRELWYKKWKEEGVTQQQLADDSGVSRQIIYLELKRYREETK